MENNQNINNFDAMLKQSLEGSQMPVPAGVWEAVGSSIGTKAIVATKIASLKLLILKTVAGVVLAGGVGYGVYELFKPSSNNDIIKTPITENNSSETETTPNTILQSNENPSTSEVAKISAKKDDSLVFTNHSDIYTNSETPSNKEVIDNSKTENKESKVTENQSPVTKSETPKKQSEPEKINEPVKETPKEEPIVTPAFPEPPNVFTPDGDGLNDDFKIVVENEKIFNLQIYDDQGKKVFETNDKNIGWNGKNMFTGEVCKRGVYIYTYYYELNTGFRKKDRSILNLL